MRSLSLTIGALLAAASAAQAADSLPKDYKQQVNQLLRETLVDPYSILDAEMTAPTTVRLFGSHPGVCIRFNPKNNYGAYAGLRTYAVSFADGKLQHARPPSGGDCQKVVWRSFAPPSPH